MSKKEVLNSGKCPQTGTSDVEFPFHGCTLSGEECLLGHCQCLVSSLSVGDLL